MSAALPSPTWEGSRAAGFRVQRYAFQRHSRRKSIKKPKKGARGENYRARGMEDWRKSKKVNIFTSFYVIFTVKYAVIEKFCVILQRSSEHVLLKQRSVMLDLRIET